MFSWVFFVFFSPPQEKNRSAIKVALADRTNFVRITIYANIVN
jgi:hypothetical protein